MHVTLIVVEADAGGGITTCLIEFRTVYERDPLKMISTSSLLILHKSELCFFKKKIED